MGAQITLIAEGEALDADGTEQELGRLSDATFERIGPERGVAETAVKVVRWVLEFAGDISKIADTLVKVAESQPPGVDIKVKFGDREVVVSNVNREKLKDTLNMIYNMAQATEEL